MTCLGCLLVDGCAMLAICWRGLVLDSLRTSGLTGQCSTSWTCLRRPGSPQTGHPRQAEGLKLCGPNPGQQPRARRPVRPGGRVGKLPGVDMPFGCGDASVVTSAGMWSRLLTSTASRPC